MTSLKIGNWQLDGDENRLSNDVLDKSFSLTSEQFNILQCLFEEAGDYVDLNDLASIGWPKESVSNKTIMSRISELNEKLCSEIRIDFDEERGACLVVIMPISEQEETLKSIESDITDEPNPLDAKTVLSAIIIVAITALIMIYS